MSRSSAFRSKFGGVLPLVFGYIQLAICLILLVEQIELAPKLSWVSLSLIVLGLGVSVLMFRSSRWMLQGFQVYTALVVCVSLGVLIETPKLANYYMFLASVSYAGLGYLLLNIKFKERPIVFLPPPGGELPQGAKLKNVP